MKRTVRSRLRCINSRHALGIGIRCNDRASACIICKISYSYHRNHKSYSCLFYDPIYLYISLNSFFSSATHLIFFKQFIFSCFLRNRKNRSLTARGFRNICTAINFRQASKLFIRRVELLRRRVAEIVQRSRHGDFVIKLTPTGINFLPKGLPNLQRIEQLALFLRWKKRRWKRCLMQCGLGLSSEIEVSDCGEIIANMYDELLEIRAMISCMRF